MVQSKRNTKGWVRYMKLRTYSCEAIMEVVCDHYCKYRELADQDVLTDVQLDEACDHCQVERMLQVSLPN